MSFLLIPALDNLLSGGGGPTITGFVTASNVSPDEGATVTLTFTDTSIQGAVTAADLTPNENEIVTLEFDEVANDYQWIDGNDGTNLPGQDGLTTEWTANPDEQPPRVRVTNPITLQSKVFNPPAIEVAPFVPTIIGTFAADDLTPDVGNDVTFTLTLTSVAVGTYTFQLTRNNVDVPGATTNPFALTDWEEADDGDYRIVVTDDGNAEVRTFGPVSVVAASGPAPVDLIDATWEVSYTGTAATIAADGATVTGVPAGLSGSVTGGVLTITGVPT